MTKKYVLDVAVEIFPAQNSQLFSEIGEKDLKLLTLIDNYNIAKLINLFMLLELFSCFVTL